MSSSASRKEDSAVEALSARLPSGVVGARIQRERKLQKISVRDMAARAGLSKSSIMNLEQGREVRPSTITKVCGVLRLHVERLAEPEVQELAKIHRRGDDQWFDMNDFTAGPVTDGPRPTDLGDLGALVAAGCQSPLLMLKSRLSGGKILPSVLEVFQQSRQGSHPGEEFAYVLRGRAKIVVGQAEFVLATGESLTFWASEPHSYGPAAEGATALILSVRVSP